MNAARYHGWRVVAACFAVAGVAWSLGLFGASVYLQAITQARGWPVSQVALAITAFFLVAASLQRVVGRAIDRRGPRPVLTAGLLAMTVGVALVGQARTPWQLYPCFVLIGIGWACLSTTALSATVAPWFERHQGRSITLAIMGASLGAILGVPLLLAAVQGLGVTAGLLAVALAALALLLPLIRRVLRHRGPADLGLLPDGESLPAGAVVTPIAAPLAARGRPRMLLWSCATAFALALTVQIGFITHHVALAAPLLGVAGAGALVSATGLTAFAGRLLLARVVDRLSVRGLSAAAMLAQALALGAIAAWPAPAVLVGASLLYGWGIGQVTTLAPVVVRREFGAAAFGATYGAAAMLIQFSSAAGPALFGLGRDALGGYRPVLAVAALLALGAAAVVLLGAALGRRPPPGR